MDFKFIVNILRKASNTSTKTFTFSGARMLTGYVLRPAKPDWRDYMDDLLKDGTKPFVEKNFEPNILVLILIWNKYFI